MKRLSATGMLVLLLLASWGTVLPTASAQNNLTLPTEPSVNLINAQPSTVYTALVEVENQSTFFMNVDCTGCLVTLNRGDTTHTFSDSPIHTDLTVGQWQLNLTVEEQEAVRYSFALLEAEDYPVVRPAPGQASASHTAGRCETAQLCMDVDQRGLLGTPPEGQEEHYLTSGLLSGADEFVVFDVRAGDTVEWQWLATSAGVVVEAYAQTNATESILPGNSSLTSAYLQPENGGNSTWWTAADDGRLGFRLSTSETEAAWMAFVFVHQAQAITDLTDIDLSQPNTVQGHGSTTGLFDWPVNTKLTLASRYFGAEVRLDRLMNGSWILGTWTALNASSDLTVYPYPGVTGGRVVIESAGAFAIEITAESYADVEELDGPSYVPNNLEADNRSWPVLNLSRSTSAELTLAVHDTSDTFRVVVEGWEDSIHYVQFTLDGNVSGMEAQMWDIDQITGEVLATDITRPVTEQLRIGLQVGRGTHFVQFRLQDPNTSTTHLWGNDVAPIRYTITADYDLMDEGEEPWFEPSEDAVWWGNAARWFLGFLFLIPAAYVAVLIRRDRRFALELVQKASRLDWYSQRLSSGESTIKASRRDLNRALMAVAQLPWEEGINAWGRPTLTHTTEGVAMGVWRVDKRLANTEGACPLVIGVHVLKGTWELAALRFDAPHGQAFEVIHVEPRFLHQGEEVFLDTLNEGHRAFVYVEIKGEAPSVDIELNGRIDRVPFASRMPQTLLMEEE